MPLEHTHDVAETLQYCMEGLSEVDRAFITVRSLTENVSRFGIVLAGWLMLYYRSTMPLTARLGMLLQLRSDPSDATFDPGTVRLPEKVPSHTYTEFDGRIKSRCFY